MRLTFQWLTLAAAALVCAIYWLTTLSYPAESIVFPRLVMGVMFVGAALAVLRHCDAVTFTDVKQWLWDSRSARLLAMLFAYAPVYYFTGFIVSSVSFLAAALVIFGVRGLLVPTVAVVTVAVLYLIFSVGLNVVL